MGIRIPAQIAFAVKGYHLLNTDTKMNGSLRIASNIISLDYLWNIIRVQGGAYGAGFPVGRDGGMILLFLSDPSPARSLQVYDALSGILFMISAKVKMIRINLSFQLLRQQNR